MNRSTGQEYVFVFNRWLAQDEGDRALGAFRNRTINPVKRFESPYSGTRVWTHELGGAEAEAYANKASGGIGLYLDSYAGGATATAGQTIWVNTPEVVNLTVNALVRYVGGTVNFAFASFSELELFWETNGNLSRRKISPAFSGPVVLDKILSLALLGVPGVLGELREGAAVLSMAEKLRRAKEIVEVIGVVYNLYQLGDALSRLEGAGTPKQSV